MGREQGDELPENPPVYVRVDEHGENQTRKAYSPTDAVNLEARGWVRQDSQPTPAPAPATRTRPMAQRPAEPGPGVNTEGNGPA